MMWVKYTIAYLKGLSKGVFDLAFEVQVLL